MLLKAWKYRVWQQNSLLEIEERAALAALASVAQCCPLIHFLWVILLPNSVQFIASCNAESVYIYTVLLVLN